LAFARWIATVEGRRRSKGGKARSHPGGRRQKRGRGHSKSGPEIPPKIITPYSRTTKAVAGQREQKHSSVLTCSDSPKIYRAINIIAREMTRLRPPRRRAASVWPHVIVLTIGVVRNAVASAQGRDWRDLTAPSVHDSKVNRCAPRPCAAEIPSASECVSSARRLSGLRQPRRSPIRRSARSFAHSGWIERPRKWLPCPPACQ
jgi:hypothetical protein